MASSFEPEGSRTSTNLNIAQGTKVDGQWTFVETEAYDAAKAPLDAELVLLDAMTSSPQVSTEAATLRMQWR